MTSSFKPIHAYASLAAAAVVGVHYWRCASRKTLRERASSLISPAELQRLLKGKEGGRVRIVDCSWYLPSAKRDPKSEFAQAHIPGAQFFDVDEIAEPLSTKEEKIPLPHKLPSAKRFSAALAALGIGKGDIVVLYDTTGIYCGSARLWWTFQAYGGSGDVRILSGGFRAWQEERRPTEMGPGKRPEPVTSEPWPVLYNPTWFRSMRDVMENATAPQPLQVVDARSPGRFLGTEPEPRFTKRAGHVKGAVNLPFDRLLQMGPAATSPSAYRSEREMRKIFEESGVDLAKPFITYCGSGMTAANLVFAAYLCGAELGHMALYDGSMVEWLNEEETRPLTVSPPPSCRSALLKVRDGEKSHPGAWGTARSLSVDAAAWHPAAFGNGNGRMHAH